MVEKEITVKIPEKVKILAINFSPRKDGITSEMMKESLEWAKSMGYVEIEYIDAADYNFYPCEGSTCMKCWGYKAPADNPPPAESSLCRSLTSPKTEPA